MDEQEAGQYVLGLLARREYSSVELQQKLTARGLDPCVAERVIESMQVGGYQSDQRYAEMIIRHSYQRQQGPEKARLKLRQSGVQDETIRAGLESFDQDWFELARSLRTRRFGDRNDWRKDYKEKARQMRFLMSRGFSRDQIDYAFEAVEAGTC